jgi:hypothetical protein
MYSIEIRIQGKIDSNWSDWFEDLTIHADESGNTLLSGQLPDRSAIYGVLSRLGSLGITLNSVNCQELQRCRPGPEKWAEEDQ